jgi:hypothetical protein
MKLDDLGSNARWNVQRHWDAGRRPVLARRSPTGLGWTVRTLAELGQPLSYLLANDWQIVTKEIAINDRVSNPQT